MTIDKLTLLKGQAEIVLNELIEEHKKDSPNKLLLKYLSKRHANLQEKYSLMKRDHMYITQHLWEIMSVDVFIPIASCAGIDEIKPHEYNKNMFTEWTPKFDPLKSHGICCKCLDYRRKTRTHHESEIYDNVYKTFCEK